MKIEKLPIESINPAPYNPRKNLKPGDLEYQKLKKSIQEFDFVEPLVVNSRGNVLIGGHQRLKVLRELGYKDVEASIVDLPPKKEKALNVALNKIEGDWDMIKLKEILVDLDDGEFDIALTGFSEEDLKGILEWEKEIFEPSGLDDQSRLDQHKSIKCPECGHEFKN